MHVQGTLTPWAAILFLGGCIANVWSKREKKNFIAGGQVWTQTIWMEVRYHNRWAMELLDILGLPWSIWIKDNKRALLNTFFIQILYF